METTVQQPYEDITPVSIPWLRLAVSWTVVGIPLAWGVWQVILKSLALF
jgi:hypothetical protein